MGTENYHDYVIRDGRFIGRFDEMYQKFEDPWHQSEQPNKYARMAGIMHMKNVGVRSVLECGCGLGYYAEWIYRETGIIPKSVDLSQSAVDRAKKLFPHLDFSVADITRDLERFRDADCILFAEILWYILPELNDLFAVMRDNFKDKFLLINQVFYKGTQKYGTEYFTGMDELISYVPFELVGKCEATMERDTTIETSTIFRIR